jgi:hypothetical protein
MFTLKRRVLEVFDVHRAQMMAQMIEVIFKQALPQWQSPVLQETWWLTPLATKSQLTCPCVQMIYSTIRSIHTVYKCASNQNHILVPSRLRIGPLVGASTVRSSKVF